MLQDACRSSPLLVLCETLQLSPSAVLEIVKTEHLHAIFVKFFHSLTHQNQSCLTFSNIPSSYVGRPLSCYAALSSHHSCLTWLQVLTCHLVHAAKFFWYFFFVFLNLLFFTSWGIIAVALTPNIQVSAVLSSGVYTFWLIFGGFIVPRPQIHGWWIWSVLLLLSVCFFILFLPLGSCSLCAQRPSPIFFFSCCLCLFFCPSCCSSSRDLHLVRSCPALDT